jgi:hypothetical protein
MSKSLIRIIGLFVAILAPLCLAAFVLYARLPAMISDKVSKALETPVSLQKVALGLSNITLKNLVVSNVPKSVLPNAFSAGTISFNAPLTNYVKDDIVIEEIDMDDVYLALEFESPTNTKSNWNTLMKPLASKSSNATPSKKTVLIKTLVITNIRVDLVYKSKGANVKALPPIDKIVLTNISSEEGFPMDQLMNSVLGQMLKSVFIRQNLQDALNSLLNQPKDTVEGILSPFKGFIGK